MPFRQSILWACADSMVDCWYFKVNKFHEKWIFLNKRVKSKFESNLFFQNWTKIPFQISNVNLKNYLHISVWTKQIFGIYPFIFSFYHHAWTNWKYAQHARVYETNYHEFSISSPKPITFVIYFNQNWVGILFSRWFVLQKKTICHY